MANYMDAIKRANKNGYSGNDLYDARVQSALMDEERRSNWENQRLRQQYEDSQRQLHALQTEADQNKKKQTAQGPAPQVLQAMQAPTSSAQMSRNALTQVQNTLNKGTAQASKSASGPSISGAASRTSSALNTLLEGYQPSQNVQQAMQMLQSISGQKPGVYQENNQYTDQLQAVLANQPGQFQQNNPYTARLQQWLGQMPAAYQGPGDRPAAYVAPDRPDAYVAPDRPDAYTSRYEDQMNALLGQITNPEKFNYSFNGDEFFRSYADEYTKRGKEASMNAMAQAAALTGGYGNSYAQQVGNQAYQQSLGELYDVGLDMYDRAYNRYLNDQANRQNAFQMLGQMEDRDYNRYRDTVQDWEADRNFGYDQYRDDMNDWENDRNFGYSQYRDAVGDWESDRDFGYDQFRDAMGDWQDQRDWLTGQENAERNFQYNQYRDAVGDWQDQRNWLGDMAGAESDRQYARYRDTVGDWRTDQQFAADRLDTERGFDYDAYADRLNAMMQQQQIENGDYWTGTKFDYQKDRDTVGDEQWNKTFDYQKDRDAVEDAHWDKNFDYQQNRDAVADDQWNKTFDYQQSRDAVSDAQWQANLDETKRQFDASLDFDKMTNDQKYAYQTAMAILENGQMPSEELLMAAGLSAEDAAKLMAQIEASGTGSGGDDDKGAKRTIKSPLTEFTNNETGAGMIAQILAEQKEKKKQKAASKVRQAQSKKTGDTKLMN